MSWVDVWLVFDDRLLMDRVEQLVDQIARDVAPQMLPVVTRPVVISGPTNRKLFEEPSIVEQAVLDHAAYEEAVDALALDAVLGQIAPKGSRGPMFAAADTWRQLSASTLVPSLIVSAASELRALGTKIGAEELSVMAIRNVERCRDIAIGRKPEVVTVLGFSGIEMPANRPVELPWGLFKARNGWYGIAEFLPSRPLTCVLIAHHRLPVDMGPKVSPQRESKAHAEHEKWTDYISRLVTLSVVFSTTQPTVAPLPTFHLTILPFEAPMSVGGPMILAPPSAQRELDEAEVAEMGRWARILDDRYSSHLEVASKRLIAALAHRINPADRLIDAVTAWEALFGGQQEATLRVTGSIGWLLESHNRQARLNLQADAAGIYGLRSKVVHGKSVDNAKVHAGADRATELAVRSLSRILEGRPDLIRLESEERSRRLLFEGSVLMTPP